MTGLDPTLPRPITIRVFVPKGETTSLPRARFVPKPPAEDARDDVGCFMQLHLTQVRSSFPALTPSGMLPTKAHKHLETCLRH